MTPLQRVEVRAGAVRIRLAEIAGIDLTDETRAELETLRTEYTDLERRMAALRIADVQPEATITDTAEGRELRSQVAFGDYLGASLARTGVTGAALELNQECGLGADYFPLSFLTRDADDDLESRAAVNGDAAQSQASWIMRVFSDTAAMRLGITMPSVAPGISSYPVLGSTAAPAQRGRAESTTNATISAAISEIKPSRNGVSAIYSIEDNARLPGFAEAIRQDLQMAMTEKIDRTIFLGDSGANENVADITGLNTATITEVTLEQSEKVKGDEVLKLLAGLVDGKYASSLADVNIVASVGSNQLWLGTIQNSAASNETVAQFLRSNGVTWTTRGDIDTNTAAGDFGAFVGLQRGITNTAVAPVWSGGQLITDVYTGAKKGEIGLTLSYLWGFAIPRGANYKRLKYVA